MKSVQNFISYILSYHNYISRDYFDKAIAATHAPFD